MKTKQLSLKAERLASWSIPFFALIAVASISLQNVIYLGLVAWLVWLIISKRPFFVNSPINWPLLLLGLVLIVASLWEGRVNGSWFGLRKSGMILIFFMTANVIGHALKAQRSLNLFLVGTTVCAIWSIVSHFLGWDAGRARSFSGDYMAAGGMYMVGLVLITSRFLHASKDQQWKWFAGAVIIALALLLTYTRSSWIAAAAALLLLGFLRDWRLPAVLLLLVVLFLVIFPKSPIAQRVATLNSNHHSSNVERRYMWKSALQLIKERPLRGYGVDNLSAYYGQVANPKALEQRPPHVHNTLMQLSINGGLLAAGFYLWWILVISLYGLAAWQRLKKDDPEKAGSALGITAAMVGFFVNGLFEFNFGTAQLIAIIYFLTGLLPAFFNHHPLAPVWRLPERPRLLFLRPRFRGDVLMASVVARIMKRDYPDSQVDLLTEPASVGAATGEPAWHKIISVPRKGVAAWWRVVRQIRNRNYDAVCDLFGNPRTATLAWVSGARFKIGPKVTAYDIFYHYTTVAAQSGIRPAWESYYDILRAFGLKQLSLRPRWEISAEDQLWIKSFLKERKVTPGKIVGIFAGASHQAKRWPLENFLTLAKETPQQLGMKCIFVFGPLEKELKTDYMHASAKLSLSVEGLPPGRLAALWKQCSLIISNDAFPMHLGPAVGTPTIGLFGPSDPQIWFPYPEKNGHRFVHATPACWPCHQDTCHNMLCWQEINPDQIMAVMKNIIKSKNQKSRAKKSSKLLNDKNKPAD